MRLIIDARLENKVQLLPSRMGWLHRITFFRWGRRFKKVVDLDGGEFEVTVSIPGPLDVTINGRMWGDLDALNYTITASVHPDGLTSAVIWSESAEGRTNSQMSFDWKPVRGSSVKGTIRVEA